MLFEDSLATTDPTRQKLRDWLRADETELIEQLLPLADSGSAARSRTWERARSLVVAIRHEQLGKGGVDALLQEFALSSEEGVVLMCLAEALLRVPDHLTMDRLIRDKLATGNWSSHLGNSESVFVNASAWGLLLTGKLVTYNNQENRHHLGLLKKTMGRVGEPVIRAAVRYAMQVMGTQFVLGTTIKQAVERAREAEAEGYRYSYDMLGEGARTMADAKRYYESYQNAIEVIGKAASGRGPLLSPGISVKLSALHPRYEFSHRDRVMNELLPRLKSLALMARAYGIGFTVDAEEAERLDMSLDIIEALFADAELNNWEGFGIAVQAYQKRALWVVEWVRELTLRVGRRMMVRLVKGAYWDTEIKLAQVEGLRDFPVFTRKASTDVCYQACARKLLDYRDTLYPQFATHNAYTVASILEMDQSREGYEFQRLHGMGEALYERVVATEQLPCRIYAPVGLHEDLLAYLVRRLLENGANSSFVNNILDESVPIDALLEDPVEQVRGWSQIPNPHILAPPALFGPIRQNSYGMDLADPQTLMPARKVMDAWLQTLPLDYIAPDTATETLAIRNPADHRQLIGTVAVAGTAEIEAALALTHRGFPSWERTPVAERAHLLNVLADSLEEHRLELIALCCKEAGKCIGDGVAEVREAVDFCRYYAATALAANFEQHGLAPRGVALCISPWNFPLAIFLGQVSAALVSGNTVVAKAAEQTSLIATRVLALMYACGFPGDAIQLIIAAGARVGAQLVPDPRIKSVIFTGSTATGNWLAQTLARRADAPVPLIAETGGQNCMVVDSSALPEQVVDDVIASGFQSAGQRCSALRVLYLQHEIADKVIAMIIGAMRELTVADPELLSTDVGPVIDHKALERLQQHVDYMATAGRLLHCCAAPTAGEHTFFAPRLYEISNLSLLPGEVFGPIIHVIRYQAAELHQVLEQINHTGFGLTFGIHSRIETVCREAAARVQAGNIYINRNMIGAVVGVQPFGGRGLSGTGPKAGGPWYLSRLVGKREDEDSAVQQVELPADDDGEIPAQLSASHAAQTLWSGIDVNDRISHLRSFIASYARRSGVEDTLNLETTLGAARDQLRYAMELLAQPATLPGPTGEANTLVLEPRGCLLIVLDDATCNGEYLMAILSTLAAGNAVIAAASRELIDEWRALAAALTTAGVTKGAFTVAALTGLRAALMTTDSNGALVHARSRHLHAVAQLLAAREGAMVPLISSVSPRTLLRQTLLEKTISINTTAAGGNASLMTMAG